MAVHSLIKCALNLSPVAEFQLVFHSVDTSFVVPFNNLITFQVASLKHELVYLSTATSISLNLDFKVMLYCFKFAL